MTPTTLPAYHLLFLPPETLNIVFQCLDFKSAVRFGRTSTILYQLHEKESLWEYFCIRDFFSGASINLFKPKPLDINWKSYYQYFEKFLLLPFPGKEAVFKLVPYENWSVGHEGANLVRILSFKSETNDSLIKEFQLLGYESGKVGLSLTLSDNGDAVETYFGAVIDNSEEKMVLLDDGLYFEQRDELRKIFKVLKEFNQIPAEHLNLVENLAMAANWKSVTPLTPEETIQLKTEIETYRKSLNSTYLKESLLQVAIEEVDRRVANLFMDLCPIDIWRIHGKSLI